MVLLTQTSWQEFSLSNVLETLKYAPLNLSIGKSPILHYTFPNGINAGAIVIYKLQYGFRVVKWTGVVSSVKDNCITTRLDEGPFRGFTATHEFLSEGNLTACYDRMSFQGFTGISEEAFERVIADTSIVYGIFARKAAREITLSVESRKKTQAFEALDQNASVG